MYLIYYIQINVYDVATTTIEDTYKEKYLQDSYVKYESIYNDIRLLIFT